FREARLPPPPQCPLHAFFWVLAEPGSGVNADLPLRTVPVGRFSQCPFDARCVPCCSGSVGHCCGTETRMLDGKAKPVVIPSGCRHRATCAFSAAWPLRRRGISDSVTLIKACVRASLGKRCAVSRWHSPPVQRQSFCVGLMFFMRRFKPCSAWLFNLHF
ncbi:hypothetical protein TcCL_ESM07503, partial [Trypanosoma cruzi]